MNEERTYLWSNDDNAKSNQSGKWILTGLSLQFKSHKELSPFCHVNSIPDHDDLHRNFWTIKTGFEGKHRMFERERYVL